MDTSEWNYAVEPRRFVLKSVIEEASRERRFMEDDQDILSQDEIDNIFLKQHRDGH